MNNLIKAIGLGVAVLLVGAVLGGPETFGLFAMGTFGFVLFMGLVAACWFPESLQSVQYHEHRHTHRLEQPQPQPPVQYPQVAQQSPHMISMTPDEYFGKIDRAVKHGQWIAKKDTEHRQKEQRWQVVDNKRLTAK